LHRHFVVEVFTDQYSPVLSETYDFFLALADAPDKGKVLSCGIPGTVPLTKLKLILTMEVDNIK